MELIWEDAPVPLACLFGIVGLLIHYLIKQRWTSLASPEFAKMALGRGIPV